MSVHPFSLGLALATSLAVATGCAPGGAAKAVRGEAPTAADAMGGNACMNPDEPTEPWTFDLDGTDRGQLTTALRKDNLVLVKYGCDGLRVVRGCKARGNYEYARYPLEWGVIDLQDSDEVRASLSGGAMIAAELKAEMERGTALVIAHGEVGMSSTTVTGIGRDQLRGSTCEDATHFVEVVHFGAFAMQTSTAAEIGSAVEIFDQGVSANSASSAKTSKRSGKRASCEKDSEADAPIAGCDAVVRVRLVPIEKASPKGSGPPPPPPPRSSRPASCPPGFVRSNNRCVKPSRAKNVMCRPGDAKGCRSECDRGNAASCVALGAIYEKGKGVRKSGALAKGAYEKACRRNDVRGCTGLAYLYSKGDGVKKDARRAKSMFESGCRKADARACSGLGQLERLSGNISKAIPHFSRACKLGYARGCFYEGAMRLKDKRGYQRAVDVFVRACNGGDYRGCLSAAHTRDSKPGVRRDPKRSEQERRRAKGGLRISCDIRKDAGACETLGEMYSGAYGAKLRNSRDAKKYFGKACAGGKKKACRR